MPIFQVKTEIQFPELLALLDFSRRVRIIQREEELWQVLAETAAEFYDNVALFVPINTHQLRLAFNISRDPNIHAKFSAVRDRVLIDTQVTPRSLVSTCFRTKVTSYIKEDMATDEELAEQNRLVMELMRPTDGLNVPVLVGDRVKAVLGCINTSPGHDSLANVALAEILAHLASDWYEMYERSLQFALTEQTWKDTTLQILHEAFNSLQQSLVGIRLVGRGTTDLSDTQQRHLQTLEDNHQHLRRLLNELRDFCQLDRGAMPLQLHHYPPERLFKVVEETIAGLAPEAQARVNVARDVTEPFDVVVDLDRFRQIVTNLVTNAVKYSGDRITVEVHCRQPVFTVTVLDRGPGISPEEQPKIFDPYYRIKNKAPTDPSGWGLGLYITKRLVEMHRGELEVKSVPTQGSAFTVRLFGLPRAA